MAEQNVFNLMQNDEIGLLWKKIYQLHQKTKIYLLTAEEISENGDALIQPLKKKKIQKEWDSVNKRTKTIPKNQGTKKDSEVHPKEAAEQEEKHISKKKSKDSGQMSLFDMMQPKES